MDLPLIEYIRGKIYLGAYDYVPEDTATRTYLTIDDTLPYNHFHHDFGPLTIAHLYRFAVILHEVLGKPENKTKELVFYSYTDPRSRANAAALLASYMIIVQNWQPHQVLAPIAQMAPVMPFRDAGYSVADFIITVQDVAYALWRAKSHGLLELRQFDLEEHETHELVQYGDLNAIGEHFVAFASPVTGNPSVEHVLRYFRKHDVRLVVRLNSKLYDKQIFERRGIKHIDLIFDDGTCPTMAFVQGFIGAADCVIKEGGKIAVHCRAGLGRTGCLIGAHLIYSYGFTAQEAIAYMRFLRPGMVVGPQQHWLYQHQHEFRDWRRTMRVGTVPDPSLANYCPLVNADQVVERPAQSAAGPSRTPKAGPRTPERNILVAKSSASVNSLPQPTPGQPRKAPSPVHVRTTQIVPATNSDDEGDEYTEDEADVIITSKRTTSRRSQSLRLKNNRSVSALAARPRGASRRIDNDSENCVLTNLSSPEQLALAKQLRVASNPSPRRRRPEEGLEPIDNRAN